MEDKDAVAVGRVYVVGAGPGDPDLLTIKAFFLLTADVVIAPSLVPDSILKLARWKVVKVGRVTAERHKEIVTLAVEEAKRGRVVVIKTEIQ